jgi:hypothetical protein
MTYQNVILKDCDTDRLFINYVAVQSLKCEIMFAFYIRTRVSYLRFSLHLLSPQRRERKIIVMAGPDILRKLKVLNASLNEQ